MKNKPKPTENKAKDIETQSRIVILERELGKLTKELAIMQKIGNEKVRRSNEILLELERLDGKK